MSQPSEALSTKKENAGKTPKPSWVDPSFGGFSGTSMSDSTSFKRPTAKRQKKDDSRRAGGSSNVSALRLSSKMTWVEKYTPQNRADLAVHSRKVDDVYTWLEESLKKKNKASVLVLTGPPGTGKTATLRVAAREMSFLLREWITPVNSNLFTEDEEGKKRFDRGYTSEYDLVKDFLLRASRYPSVVQGEAEVGSSVVLVEDLPLTFHRDPGAFHDLLWEYVEVGRSPLVMIVDTRVFRKLFPDLVVTRLGMKVIEFNPVATSIMTRLLQNIVLQETQNVANKSFQGPPRDVIESIYQSSCGDLRSAINTLQFACLRGCQNIVQAVKGKTHVSPKKTAAKKTTSSLDADLATIGGRDAPDDFFRLIGRVLYAKREPSEAGRGALLHKPQDIVASNSGSADLLTGFLHENYLAHFSADLHSIDRAAQYLGLADTIMGTAELCERELPRQLGLSVAVQSLMFCRPAGSSSLGFRPHRKPRSIAASKAYEERRERARLLFPNCHCSSYELLTELVPYLGQIGGAACSSQAQVMFIESTRLERTSSWVPPLRTASQSQTAGEVAPVNGLRARSSDDDPDAILLDSVVIEDIDSD